MNSDSDLFALRNAAILFGRYRLDFLHDQNGNRDRVTFADRLAAGEAVTSWCRFIGSAAQGELEHRTEFTLLSDDVPILSPVLRPFVRVRDLTARVMLRRRYTLGILAGDRRDADPVTNDFYDADDRIETVSDAEGHNIAAALAAKPASSAALDVEEARVRIRITLLGGVVVPAVLLAAFFFALGAYLFVAALLPWVAVAINPGTIVAGLVAIATITLMLVIIGPIIAGRVASNRLREALEDQDTLDALADAGMLMYAGEGLAEALAQEVLATGGIAPDPNASPGRRRFRQQFWQMLHVGTRFCRFLVRP